MENSITNYYNSYDEDGRLFRDYSHQIEWLTTMHYFDKIIPACSKIFDGCAGTGNYAFKLAEQGHRVAASDIVPHNVDIMLQKQERSPILDDIFVGDICACNHYNDHYFDAVLCMGAFYHLDETMRYKAMEQCLRLLKDGGILVISYINLITVLHMNLKPGLENISEILKCCSTKSLGDSFVYMMPEEIEDMAAKYKLTILNHITSDGNPLARGADFNKARKEDFEKYMELHLSICENKSLLGYGLHGLVFLTNK
ncbi:class I SAM-dependent methyltransferase [Clostridium sp. MCC353]|uniref:class I SAM-dependent methyltransferase n=1 Tax=Clostridium sp. MCC353 TaxID=2592646 RepID=UPI001C020733|nr:class I SAM-dependent methyltransferase [Clostridium sp. MCC353]